MTDKKLTENERRRQYYLANREKLRRQARAQYIKHRAKRQEESRKRYYAHREFLLEYGRKYYAEHRDELKIKNKEAYERRGKHYNAKKIKKWLDKGDNREKWNKYNRDRRKAAKEGK